MTASSIFRGRIRLLLHRLQHAPEPFDDARVRRALGMAIDTQKIIDFAVWSGGTITGPFVKQTDYYNPAIAPLPYDPQGACPCWKRPAGAGTTAISKKRQTAGVHAHHQQRQPVAQSHFGHCPGCLEENRHPGGDRSAGMVGVSFKSGSINWILTPDPGVVHGHRPRSVPDLALQPDRPLPAQFRGLRQSRSRRFDTENQAGIRP
jgi:hypothetical protein